MTQDQRQLAVRRQAAVSVIHYVEGWLDGAGHMGAASYLRNHLSEIVDQMADDGCLPELA